MPWNLTLKCDHRYQVAEAPDLARPVICPQDDHGLQMIVAAIQSLYAEAQAHNDLARRRRRDEDRAARRRATAERRAKVARGELPACGMPHCRPGGGPANHCRCEACHDAGPASLFPDLSAVAQGEVSPDAGN